MEFVGNAVLSLFEIIQSIFVAASCCALFIVMLSPIAERMGLIDKSSKNDKSSIGVPLIGGVAIFLSVSITLLFVIPTRQVVAPLMLGSVLVLVGAIDDRFNLRVVTRLVFQIATASGLIYVGGISIESLGNITGSGPVKLAGIASVLFTVVCTVGVINSINMIDGVDGLSGVIVALTLLPLTYFSWIAGDKESVLLLLSFLAALASFLYFNLRAFRTRAAVFMGDSGSMLFGLLIVWFFIHLTQGESPSLSPVAAGWIFGLPLIDTVSVMVHRILSKRSPFDSDRNHLHHQLLDTGLSANQTVGTMALVHSGFVLVGLLCNANPQLDAVFFWSFVLVVILHYMLTPRVLEWFKISGMNIQTSDKKSY